MLWRTEEQCIRKRASEDILFCAGGAQLHQKPGDSMHARTAGIALVGHKKLCPIMVQCPVQKLKSSPSGSRSLKGNIKAKGRGNAPASSESLPRANQWPQ